MAIIQVVIDAPKRGAPAIEEPEFAEGVFCLGVDVKWLHKVDQIAKI